ncbi:MAG: VOC family protein, partial [Ginsengibacter sp.]
FYKSVFGGEFANIMRFKDLASPEFPVSEREENKIMHIALPIGKSNMLMGNDVPESMGRTNENENRSKIVISAESKEEADRLFNGLSAGGQIEGAIGDSPWGSYFGCFRDKYGIEWIVNFDPDNKGQI